MSNQEGSSGNGGGQAMGSEGSMSLQYPMLTKRNYAAWCTRMEEFMEAQGVWGAIEGEGTVDTRKDKMALAAIYQGISEETLLQLGARKTAKEAWNALKTMFLRATRVKEVRAHALRWELEGFRMRDDDTVDDFTSKIAITVNQLRSLGETVEEAYVVKKILRAVSPKFLQIAFTIEEFRNVESKSIEEITGSLRAHEERMKGHENRTDGQILLTQGEWGSRTYEGNQNRGRGRYGSLMRGRGRNFGYGGRDNFSRPRPDMNRLRCYTCNEIGHFAYECRRREKEEEMHLMERRDDDPALLVLEECETTHSDLDISNDDLHAERRKEYKRGRESEQRSRGGSVVLRHRG